MAGLNISEKAQDLHYKSLVIDGLEAAPMTEAHFDRLRTGGIGIVHYTCAKVTDDFSSAALNILNLQKTVEANPDRVMLVKTSDDVRIARETHKIGIILGFQSAQPIMDDLNYLELVYRLGIRVIQLTYNERNLLGDGCVESANGGLSRYGRQVVEAMNSLGIAIDLSHCGEKTTLEAIELSSDPVLITHANAKMLCPSPRNKSDAILQSLSRNGGVIGAAFWGPLTYSDTALRPGINDFLNHVDYLVEHAGIEHVAIGSDLGEGESREGYEAMFIRGGGLYPEVTRELGDWYTFENRMVKGLESATCFPLVTNGLLERGYSEADIQKILGRNFYRVFTQVVG
ncbi:MAG: dipeptidase [Chloroflexi bacterium]|nr:dipeptidase [Chloroflexota bacterium]